LAGVSSTHSDVAQFIASTFPSVWALEVLLALKADRRTWSPQELVLKLRASELVVSSAVDALVAAGLASTERGGAAYTPIDKAMEHYVDKVERLYRSHPNSVRRTIVSAGASRATAFADAFKLRRESDD
jgi:hypothetical protein